jgi:hypothetical protein
LNPRPCAVPQQSALPRAALLKYSVPIKKTILYFTELQLLFYTHTHTHTCIYIYIYIYIYIHLLNNIQSIYRRNLTKPEQPDNKFITCRAYQFNKTNVMQFLFNLLRLKKMSTNFRIFIICVGLFSEKLHKKSKQIAH